MRTILQKIRQCSPKKGGNSILAGSILGRAPKLYGRRLQPGPTQWPIPNTILCRIQDELKFEAELEIRAPVVLQGPPAALPQGLP